MVEIITDDGPGILTIRGLDVDFGNRIASHHLAGFTLTKIVCNGTARDRLWFDLELREHLRDYSSYEDGLSFGQGTIAGRPFLSDTFDYADEISEPFDRFPFAVARCRRAARWPLPWSSPTARRGRSSTPCRCARNPLPSAGTGRS